MKKNAVTLTELRGSIEDLEQLLTDLRSALEAGDADEAKEILDEFLLDEGEDQDDDKR